MFTMSCESSLLENYQWQWLKSYVHCIGCIFYWNVTIPICIVPVKWINKKYKLLTISHFHFDETTQQFYEEQMLLCLKLKYSSFLKSKSQQKIICCKTLFSFISQLVFEFDSKFCEIMSFLNFFFYSVDNMLCWKVRHMEVLNKNLSALRECQPHRQPFCNSTTVQLNLVNIK